MIRPEGPSEYSIVDTIHERAFGRGHEARVVRAIRKSAGYVREWSLVAERAGEISGHILFSRVGLEDADGHVREIVVLAPLAVLPGEQRRGLGSALVQHGIALLESVSEPIVVVRGELVYYRRFGFQPSLKVRIAAPFEVDVNHYLAKPLAEYSRDYCGVVRYPATFRSVGYEAEWDYPPRPVTR